MGKAIRCEVAVDQEVAKVDKMAEPLFVAAISRRVRRQQNHPAKEKICPSVDTGARQA